MTEEIKFEVGQKYENMKGVFEVIAIRKDSMDIRWEDGETIDTPIALQKRIIERMRYEKELEEAKKAQKAKKAKAKMSKGAKQFAGLEAADFTSSVSKTTWRGRGQLGGAVTRHLKRNPLKFNSWAVLRKPEVNWLEVGRQKAGDVRSQAVFYARIEQNAFSYGFHIPSPGPVKAVVDDWKRFIEWLGKTENSAWLADQCSTHGLVILDQNRKGFAGTLEARNDQWVHVAEDQEETIESLLDHLRASSKSGAMQLRIEKKVDKETAIEKKQAIALDVAALFESLMPLYVALATQSG